MQTTLKNRTIFCADNIDVLRGINTETVDLIYLDPPFNKNKVFTSPLGSQAEGASFRDIFYKEDIKNAQLAFTKKKYPKLATFIDAIDGLGRKGGKEYNKYYLIYMAVRLVEMYRILKQTGSLYLHCDPTMSHYLKLVLDGIFGEKNFVNEIVWDYKKISNAKGKKFNRRHDTLFLYSKSARYVFHHVYEELSERKQELVKAGFNTKNMNGERYIYIYDIAKVKEKGIDLNKYDKIKYVDTSRGTLQGDVVNIDLTNSQSKEYVGYPTQKPLALLERIIQTSSNEGDVVLDPFCGCATACVAAERLGRQWIGIDVSAKAYELVQYRLKKEVVRADEIFKKKVFFREGRDAYVQRTDLKGDPRSKKEIKKSLYGDQGGYCNLCDHHFEPRHLEIDHILPRAKGGGDNYANLQLLCSSCNRIKSNRTMAEAQAILRRKPD